MLSLCHRVSLASPLRRVLLASKWRPLPSLAPSLASLHVASHSRQTEYQSCVGADNIVRSPFEDVALSNKSLFHLIFDEFPKHARKVAFVDGVSGRGYTFSEIEESTSRASSALNRVGFKRGDVLAICAPNSPEYAAMFFATLASGGIVSTCNPSYKSDEFLYQFRNSNASVVVTVPEILSEVRKAAEAAGVKRIIVIDDSDQVDRTEKLLSFREMIADSGSKFDSKLASTSDDIVVLPYSSGTTGLPKGVMLTNHNVVSNILQLENPRLFDLRQDGTTLMGVLPFFHIYGMVVIMFSSLYSGCRTVTLPKFDPEMFLAAIQDQRINTLHAVPPILLFLAKHPIVDKFDLSSLKDIMSGAAPLGGEIVQAVREKIGCKRVRQGYGLTETSPVTHVMPTEMAEAFAKPGSIGFPICNMLCKVVDSDTHEALPTGREGELWLAGPNIMKGYLNNPQATAETITGDGWLRSGDIGYFDEEGCFYITDRLKELIKVKGLQVAPAELEALLVTHDQISDAAVVSASHERFGEAPRAFVVRTDESLSERDVADFVAGQVAEHKQLAGGVRFIEAIPKSASGKILRRVLREQ